MSGERTDQGHLTYLLAAALLFVFLMGVYVGSGGIIASLGTPSVSTTAPPSASQSIAATAGTGTLVISILPDSGANLSSKGYSPDVAHVVIGVNNTVTWVNNDSVTHTVTSVTYLFDSGNLKAGQSWSYTFETPGTYQYRCIYHGWMTGTVIVTAA